MDPVLMELKDSMQLNMNESFPFGDDYIHMYQDRICVPDVDDLKTKLITENYVAKCPNFQQVKEKYLKPGDLTQIY